MVGWLVLGGGGAVLMPAAVRSLGSEVEGDGDLGSSGLAWFWVRRVRPLNRELSFAIFDWYIRGGAWGAGGGWIGGYGGTIEARDCLSIDAAVNAGLLL